MLFRNTLWKIWYLNISFTISLALALGAHSSHGLERPATHPHSLAKRFITQQDRTFYKFVTRPDIDAPVFDIEVHDEDSVAPGYWFIAPYGRLSQDRPGQHWDGPHIYDGNGELIWSGTPMFGYWNVYDFESRIVDGEAMITLLSDHEKHGFILDNTYEIRKAVSLLHEEGHAKPNMHSFNVLDDGKSALLLTHTDEYSTKEAAKVVGFNGKCNAKYQGFREVSLESAPGTQDVLFEWDSKDHIQLDEVTYRKYDGSIKQQCKKGWDILHLNSVDKFPDGDYLLSARHTDTLYKISHKDGSIVWRLGGVKSDFEQNDKFSRQHHGHVLEQNATHTILTVFDNGIGDGPFEHATARWARGLVILLDTVQMKAEVTGIYKQPGGERTNARGSFQTLPNGNKFLCWSWNSHFTEHSPDGTIIMEASIPIKLRSYRAFKHPWVGAPKQPPDVYSEAITLDEHPITAIYVSWNGDTRTAKWEFSEIDERGNTQVLGSTEREGFETRFEYEKFARRVFAEAIDKDGNRLAKSEVATTARPPFLEEGGFSPGGVPDGEEQHLPESQDDEVSEESASLLDLSGESFAIGIVCGVAVCAMVWASVWFSKGRASTLLRRRRETKYMPLQQDTD